MRGVRRAGGFEQRETTEGEQRDKKRSAKMHRHRQTVRRLRAGACHSIVKCHGFRAGSFTPVGLKVSPKYDREDTARPMSAFCDAGPL